MDKEKQFNKYKTRGSDYHYKQINKSNLKLFNAYIYAKFHITIELTSLIINTFNQKHLPIKILDVGCGDGVSLYLLNKKFHNYNLELFGIDNSDIALKVAKEKVTSGCFENANAYQLPFDENLFDIVISTDVIEHIAKPNKMLAEIKRVSKEDSNIIIGTPIRYTEKPLDKTHYCEFFPMEFHGLLKEFFQDVRIIQTHRLFYLLLYNKHFSIFHKRRDYFRYLINFISIFFNRNPFLKVKKKDYNRYSYIFGIGKNKK